MDAVEVLDALLLLALLCLLGALEVVLQLAPQLSRLGLGSLRMFHLIICALGIAIFIFPVVAGTSHKNLIVKRDITKFYLLRSWCRTMFGR